MYRGFKIGKCSIDEAFYEIGKALFDIQKTYVETQLKLFMNKDNSLDGSKTQENWFPQIDAHVFISHSHNDEHFAISLAGWLWDNFRITSFIDSLIWGYSNKLLKEIDDIYCPNGDGYYSYVKRNFSTSHVHMMLSTALSKMIDKTECLFFLDTPDSIKPVEGIRKTESPWIYLEISISQIVRQTIPERLKRKTMMYSEGGQILEKALKTSYEVDLKHLTEISVMDLKAWVESPLSLSSLKNLDTFYELNPPKKTSDSLHS